MQRHLLLAAVLAVATPLGAQDIAPDRYESLRQKAETLFAEGSWALANEVYLQAAKLQLPEAAERWVRFRLADTQWRSAASSKQVDRGPFDEAYQRLQKLAAEPKRVEERDELWAEIEESIGDWWFNRVQQNWHEAWQHYTRALDWWAGSLDLERAGERYKAIIFRTALPEWRNRYYYYGYHGNLVPLTVLENTLHVSKTDDERSHAHYLIAMALKQQGHDWTAIHRVPKEFQAAIGTGRKTEWYDDALYQYAEWVGSVGKVKVQEDGTWNVEPDYVRALELFRRFVREIDEGESRHWRQAQSRIRQITEPTLSVGVGYQFTPGAKIEYSLSWRNVNSISLALYPVDLTQVVKFDDPREGASKWLAKIDLSGREKVHEWTFETEDDGTHKSGSKSLRLERDIPAGAYVLGASAGTLQVRDIVLVTNACLVLKVRKSGALVYACDAVSGAPIKNARVRLWARPGSGNTRVWSTQIGETGEDGVAAFKVSGDPQRLEIYAAATSGSRQAFAIATGRFNRPGSESWRIYASTDRPAYRPGDTVEWKVIARTWDGSVHTTPAGEKLSYEVNGPRGDTVAKGDMKLSALGSAWASVELGEELALGVYLVRFHARGKRVGSAQLFRLEEYKLPEFRVTVETPKAEDGRPKVFRIGDEVEAVVSAEYYFGGPVANADVQVVVRQRPFWIRFKRHREFAWFYDDSSPRRRHYGGGQVVHQENVKTDARGRAVVRFPTPRGTTQDLEYEVEARVVDASRREIIGKGKVRVAQQKFFVDLRSEHSLHRPQDKVEVKVRTLDANEAPTSATGIVVVTRDRWHEVWTNPFGRVLEGEEVRRLRAEPGVFPPLSNGPWISRFQDYRKEQLLRLAVETDEKGEALVSFTPGREGYYRVSWSTLEPGSAPVKGSTQVFVATDASRDLGYRRGGLEIIVDRDTFRAGEKAPVMISVPGGNRWVLFSSESEDLHDWQLVHVTGGVKLLELEIGEKHVPNVFFTATMVADRQIHRDTEQVIVPPVRHFAKVEVETDQKAYEPGDEGTIRVRTLDHDGKPVAAEVALALYDAAVEYIQTDMAGDPRQFFYGRKRPLRVRTSSTLERKSFPRPKTPTSGEWGANEESNMPRSSTAQLGMPGAAGAMRDEAKKEVSRTKSGSRMRFAAEAPMGAVAAESEDEDAGGGGSEASGEVRVRTDFRATVAWIPALVTGEDGRASAQVKFPDSLTTWKAKARVVAGGNVFGVGESESRTRLPLIVRLQAPRFFVVGDRAIISAVLNNNTDEELSAKVSLSVDGLELVSAANAQAQVAARSDARVNWAVRVVRAGPVKLQTEARGGKYSDAMVREYQAHEHGIEKMITRAGKVPGNEVLVRLDLPEQRRPDSTKVEVQVTPSIAVTMLDAIPYLINYPYGCTEQTMSRFLPAIITAKTLKDLGLKPEDVLGKVFGGIEREHVEKTHRDDPTNLERMDEIVRQGLDRLYDFQHADGGWGWWKKGDSDAFMTAYVTWGLVLTRGAGVEVREAALVRAVGFLRKRLVEAEEQPDLQAWMIHALGEYAASGNAGDGEAQDFEARALSNLWERRNGLNAYSRALYALACHAFGQEDRAQVLARNLASGVKRDERPDLSVVQRGVGSDGAGVMATVHWGEDRVWRRWSDGGVETTAFVLRALLRIDPESNLVEPAMNWLVKNRRGAQWSNTRDTAMVVLAMNDWLRKSGELGSELEYEIVAGGEVVASGRVTKKTILGAPSAYEIDAAKLGPREEIRIVKKSGKGTLYFTVSASFFSEEEPIEPTGHEIFVRREYRRLVEKRTLFKGWKTEEEVFEDGGTVVSGERVEVILTIEAKNDYEYLVFEDLKPAGLEAVEVQSGSDVHARQLSAQGVRRRLGGEEAEDAIDLGASKDYTGRQRWVHRELRDRKVAVFIDKLPEGVWELRYTLRAEVPGSFHALPVLAHAMYVPEIRANSREVRIVVNDAQ